MIGIKDGKTFKLSGNLKEEMDKYIDSMVMFLSGISAKYAQNMSDNWNDNTTFGEHYESNLIFKNTINNSLEVMLKGFFEIADVEGAPSKELRDVAVYDFMRNKILAHLRKKTKEETVNLYKKYNIEAYSAKVNNLMTNYGDKELNTIASIVEVNIGNALVEENPLTPLLLQNGQKFSQWRRSEAGGKIVKDFIRFGIYFYLGGDTYTPLIQKYLDSTNISHSFVELICFELDELTKEDFIQRIQDGEVSH